MLLKRQLNQLVEILLQHDLSPNDFKKEDSANFKLTYPKYRFEYLITENNGYEGFVGGFFTSCKPDIYESPSPSGHIPMEWQSVVREFEKWSSILKEEIETPDLWAEATKTAQLFAPTAEPTDDKFTRTELAEVQGQLRLLQQRFTASALPEAAKQKLIKLTHTAAEKAEGFTKKDWQGWFIGSLISGIIALALNPMQANDVYKLVKAVFGGLFLH